MNKSQIPTKDFLTFRDVLGRFLILLTQRVLLEIKRKSSNNFVAPHQAHHDPKLFQVSFALLDFQLAALVFLQPAESTAVQCHLKALRPYYHSKRLVYPELKSNFISATCAHLPALLSCSLYVILKHFLL